MKLLFQIMLFFIFTLPSIGSDSEDEVDVLSHPLTPLFESGTPFQVFDGWREFDGPSTAILCHEPLLEGDDDLQVEKQNTALLCRLFSDAPAQEENEVPVTPQNDNANEEWGTSAKPIIIEGKPSSLTSKRTRSVPNMDAPEKGVSLSAKRSRSWQSKPAEERAQFILDPNAPGVLLLPFGTKTPEAGFNLKPKANSSSDQIKVQNTFFGCWDINLPALP